MKNESKENINKCNIVRIYHHVLDLEYQSNSVYFVIIETIDFIPSKIYTYKVPDSYKENNMIKELDELHYPYCPN